MATKKPTGRGPGQPKKLLLFLLSKVDGKPMPTYYPTIPMACAAHGISATELKRARDAACPAFRSGKIWNEELASWLAENPQSPAEDDDEEDVPDVSCDDERGAGRTLERMEAMEVEVHAKIKKALPAARPAARVEWLKVARELLRFDAGVKEADKASGRMIPQKEVVEILKRFIAWQLIGNSDAIRAGMPRLALAERSPQAMATVYDAVLRQSLMAALKMAQKIGKLPPWAIEAAGEELNESVH